MSNLLIDGCVLLEETERVEPRQEHVLDQALKHGISVKNNQVTSSETCLHTLALKAQILGMHNG